RRPEPRAVRRDGRGLFALCPGNRQSPGETAQHRHRRIEGHRGAEGGGAAPAGSGLSPAAFRRLHRGRPVVARRGRRGRYRWLLGQHRAEDRGRYGAIRHRPSAPSIQELAPIEGGLRFVQAGAQSAQGASRPEQPQRRRLPRPQRARGEKSRRRQPQGSRQRDRGDRENGPQRHYPKDRRRPRQLPRSRLCQRGRAMSVRSVVLGTGSALPRRRVTTEELAETVETSDAWIVERTGIRCRYIAGEDETTASLATDACRRALDAAGVEAAEIDLIVLATATPDQTFPSSATKVQAALGINDCIAFDVHAVCTGFLYALSVADSMLRSGNAQKALVIGAETFSRILDWEDRATCVLFGDGAGALVLSAEESDSGILATKLHADGRHNDLLFVDGGPSTTGTVGKLRMKGREVFRHAVVNLAEVMNEVLDAAGLNAADVDWVVPHQANQRILDATAKKLGLPPQKVVV